MENYYIANLEGKYFYNLINGEYVIDKNYSVKNRKMTKVYTCSLPQSLETIILQENYKKIIKECNFGKYMNIIVNVTFEDALTEKIETSYAKEENKDSKNITIYKKYGKNMEYNIIHIAVVKEDGKELYYLSDNKKDKHEITKEEMNNIYKKIKKIKSIKTLRKELYQKGFWIDGTHYVLYKRSSSKSRSGSVLFIKESMYDKMIKISRMGIKFKYGEKVDIASLKAYESLILSGIESTIEIDPESILLISDVHKTFSTIASVTSINNGKLDTKTENIEGNNSIFDGQGLVSSDLFTGEHEGKSMMLLRNHFFKMAGFSCNIAKFFEDNKEYIKDGLIPDMFGNLKEVNKIKVITTPSAIKLFKFKNKFNNNMSATYEYWKSHCYKLFGVVKHEKESKFGDYNQMSYQMLQAMPLSKDDIISLMKDEISYIELLKNNISVFRKHIECNSTSNSRELIYNLLTINDDIIGTQVFKNFKREVIKQYIKNLRKGKVKIPNTDYCVVVGNPYEMLLHSIGRYDSVKSLHNKREVWCSAYQDGEELTGFRNPLVCAGNIVALKNVFHQQFQDYFNFTENIIVVNTTEDDILERNNSMDFDSDSMLISSNTCLYEKALQCEKNYPTPTPEINAENIPYSYNKSNMAEVDHKISENMIGKIINLSCELNAIYWNEFWKEAADKELLDLLYRHISKLSCMSGIEIDKAKRFVDINMEDELNSIRKLTYLDEEVFKKEENEDGDKIKCRPGFMKYTGRSNKYIFTDLNCPMDWVQEVIKNLPDAESVNTVDITKLLNTEGIEIRKQSDRHQIKIIEDLIGEICKIQIDKNDSEEEKQKKKIQLYITKREAISRLKKMTINIATILTIIKRMYNEESEHVKLKRFGITLLGCLYKAHPNELLSAFQKTKKEIEILEKNEEGNIIIFGEKFTEIKKVI